jgi:hypothetical protein
MLKPEYYGRILRIMQAIGFRATTAPAPIRGTVRQLKGLPIPCEGSGIGVAVGFEAAGAWVEVVVGDVPGVAETGAAEGVGVAGSGVGVAGADVGVATAGGSASFLTTATWLILPDTGKSVTLPLPRLTSE